MKHWLPIAVLLSLAPLAVTTKPQRVEDIRLAVAAESGVAALFAITGGRLQPRWRGLARSNAHVVAIDPSTDVYLPLKVLDGDPVVRVMYRQ